MRNRKTAGRQAEKSNYSLCSTCHRGWKRALIFYPCLQVTTAQTTLKPHSCLLFTCSLTHAFGDTLPFQKERESRSYCVQSEVNEGPGPWPGTGDQRCEHFLEWIATILTLSTTVWGAALNEMCHGTGNFTICGSVSCLQLQQRIILNLL